MNNFLGTDQKAIGPDQKAIKSNEKTKYKKPVCSVDPLGHHLCATMQSDAPPQRRILYVVMGQDITYGVGVSLRSTHVFQYSDICF